MARYKMTKNYFVRVERICQDCGRPARGEVVLADGRKVMNKIHRVSTNPTKRTFRGRKYLCTICRDRYLRGKNG